MKKIEFGEWQLCPKCNGQGIVSKPHHVAGDVNTWVANATSFRCDVCQGAKILARPVMDPPIVFDLANPSPADIEKMKEVLSKQTMKFVPDPAPWDEKWEKVFKSKLQEESEYWFGLSHYELMYKLIGEEKYLIEKEAYKKKHGR